MKKLRCRDWMDTEDSIWIVSQEYNTLLHIDKSTKTARAEVFFKKYLACEAGWCYGSGVLSGDYIVCIPLAAKDIAIYSLRDKSICYISLKAPGRIYKEIYNPVFKFFRGCAYGDYVLIFSASYPTLIHLNLKTKKADYICDWAMEAESHILPGYSFFYFGDGYVRVEENLFLPLNCCGAFLQVELETLQCRLVFPPAELDGIEGVTQIEDILCFIGRKEDLYYLCLWRPDTDKLQALQIPHQGRSFLWISFSNPIYWKSKVYLAPQTADHFYVADLKSGEICIEKHLDKMLSECPKNLQDVKVGAVKQRGNEVTFNTWWDYKWHKYNLDTWEWEDFEIQSEDYTQCYQKELCHKLVEEGNVIIENTIPISTFLAEIKNKG